MTPIRTRFPGLQSACAGTVALAVVAMVFTVPAPRIRAQSAPMPDVKPAPTAMPAPRMAPAETVAAAQAPQPAPTPVPATQTPPTPTPAPAPAAPPAVEQATQLDPQKPEDEFGKGAYMPGTLHGVTLPTVIKQVDPEYTSEAMQAKLQGMVRMQAVINSDGRIGEIRVTRGFPKVHPDGTPAPEGKGLEDAAVEAAKGWIFEPSRRNGVAVPVIVEMELEFRLDGRADRQR